MTPQERSESGDRIAAVLVWLLLGASLAVAVLALMAAFDSQPPERCVVIGGQTLERTSSGATTASVFPTTKECP